MKKICLIILFKNHILYCFFCWLLLKFCCRLMGVAVDSDDLTVFLPSHCQVTKLYFPYLYKFLVSIAK